MNRTQFDQSKCKVGESKMVRKPQLLAIILAIFTSVGYARGPKKVIKGEDASIMEIPHQVSLQKVDGFHFCGGSIIDRQLILTAAHCIVDKEGNPIRDKIYVVIGTDDNQLITPYNKALVVRRVHHNYHHGYYSKNDIAILKVNRPIFFGISVAPAKLPRRDVRAGTVVVASGWGATKYNNRTGISGNYARFLQKHYGTVITQEKCQIAMENKHAIGPEHICVETQNGADTCKGDSGGPLTYNGQVIGIVSFGFGCGLNYPSVFTRVHHYLQWIRVVQWAMYFNTQFPQSPDFVET